MPEPRLIHLPSWPDGVTAPFFSIIHPDISVACIMPDPLKEFTPEFIGASTEKTAKYTGRIHKVYNEGELFEVEYEWVLYHDRMMSVPGGLPLSTRLSYIDVINLIHSTDMIMDKDSSASMMFIPHGTYATHLSEGDFSEGEYTPFAYRFRLAKPPEITPMKTVAKMVKLRLITDGYIDNITSFLPYSMRNDPALLPIRLT